jgi:hypothetical protein
MQSRSRCGTLHQAMVVQHRLLLEEGQLRIEVNNGNSTPLCANSVS